MIIHYIACFPSHLLDGSPIIEINHKSKYSIHQSIWLYIVARPRLWFAYEVVICYEYFYSTLSVVLSIRCKLNQQQLKRQRRKPVSRFLNHYQIIKLQSSTFLLIVIFIKKLIIKYLLLRLFTAQSFVLIIFLNGTLFLGRKYLSWI